MVGGERFGKAFSESSDLDFAIVSEHLFELFQ